MRRLRWASAVAAVVLLAVSGEASSEVPADLDTRVEADGPDITVTVRNAGATTAPPTALRLASSRDRIAGPDDHALGVRSVPALRRGASYAVRFTTTVPKRYVVACADASGAVREADEGDNCGGTPWRPAVKAAVATRSVATWCGSAPRTTAELSALWRQAGGAGWTGGDATWSARLPDGRTAWLFGDTYLGAIGPDGRRAPGTRMISNSLVVQDGGCLTTHAGGDGGALVPSPGGPDRWYWPGQPIVEGGALRVVLAEIARTGPGAWDFAGVGTAVATFSLPDLRLQSVVPVGPRGAGADVYGSAAVVAGGHTYVYGVRDHPYDKQLKVARAPAGRLDGPWTSWDGRGWSADPDRAQTVLVGVSNQLTVLPEDDRFVLVTQRAAFEREVVARTARTPTGPWVDPRVITTIPAPAPGAFTYNALVHPALSDPDRWALSWNVNGPLDQVLGDPQLYRPRFVDVRRVR